MGEESEDGGGTGKIVCLQTDARLQRQIDDDWLTNDNPQIQPRDDQGCRPWRKIKGLRCLRVVSICG